MKILIVDDKEENLILLDTLLKGCGYQVEQALNGQKALDKLRNNSFQMVISDILMPVMDGFELCQICKNDLGMQSIIFVFYTATYTTQEDEEYAHKLGADKFLIKPMEPARFLSEISDIVKKAEDHKVILKKPEITDKEAIRIHRERLMVKLGKKVEELELEIVERKKAEEKYRKLMELNPDAIIIHSEEKIVYINQTGYKLLGADHTESLIGRRIFDFIHPDYHQIMAKRNQKLLAEDSYVPFVVEKFINLKGKEIDVEETSLPTIYDGRPAILILVQDITDRKKVKEMLDRERQLFKTLMDTIPDHIYFKDMDSHFITINKALANRFDLNEPDHAIGKTDFDFFTKEHANQAFKDEQRIIKTGKPLINIIEKETRSKEQERWVSTTKMPLIDSRGDIIGTFGISRDITEHKQAEEALHESEERFRLILDSSIDGILLTAPNGDIFSANPAACKMFQRTEEEICRLGRSGLVDVSDPRLDSALKERARRRRFFGELTLMRKDGLKLPAEISSVIFKNKEGLERTSMVIRDISERKRAEIALQNSQNMLKIVLDSIPSAVFWKDQNLNYLGGNKTWLDATGLKSTEDVIGKDDYDLPWDKEQADSFRKHDRKVMDSGIPDYNIVESYLRADGSMAWAMTNKVPLRDTDGNIIGILGTYVDITEQKHAEEMVQKERIQLRTLIDNLPNDVFVKDKDYRKILFNPNHLAGVQGHLINLGMNPDIDILNKTDFEVFPKDLAEKFFMDDQKVIRDGQEIINNVEVGYGPDGSKKWLLVSKVPLKDKEGLIVGMIGIINDFSLLKEAEDQIQADLEEKEILLRELYHRTKNNMQVICSMMRLRSRTLSNDKIRHTFHEIENKIQSMALVHQKLYESQDLSSLNLKTYFKDLIALIQPILLSSKDYIQIRYEAVDVPVLIDTAIPLGLTLNELLSNAIKHAFPDQVKGQIQVKLKLGKSKEIILEVKDNGIGLPKGFDVEKQGHLGLQTVIDLAQHQLEGEVTFKNYKGLLCRIVIKKELYEPRI